MERHKRGVHGRRRSVKTIKAIRREKLERHQQWMRTVKNMPEERSSDANIMEQMEHRKMLKFISTVELQYPNNKQLDTIVEEKYERREEDENRITEYNQILDVSNLLGPKLNIKLADAGYSSLYHYQSLSAQNAHGTPFTQKNRGYPSQL